MHIYIVYRLEWALKQTNKQASKIKADIKKKEMFKMTGAIVCTQYTESLPA